MKCAQVRGLFSSYLDGAVSGKQMGSISSHLVECLACNQQYSQLRHSQ